MVFAVFHSWTFDKNLGKMPADFHDWLEKIEDQLALNPYVGDPVRVPWFREKKKDKFRVYYLIYEEISAVYLVAMSEKKNQQATINTIWLFLDQFQEEIKNLLKNKIT